MSKPEQEHVVEAYESDVEEAIANMLKYAQDIQQEASVSAHSYLATELMLAKGLISSASLIALGLHAKDRSKRLYPSDWLDPSGMPDPDKVLALGFCQLANYGYAVIDLVEKGLDTPARALVRATVELGQILTVIASDREAFQTYAANDPEGDKKKWWDLFSGKKLAKRIAKLERKFGMDEVEIVENREWRQESAEFFSEAIHHSFVSLVVGALPTVPGENRVEISLLGGPNGASRPTLTHIIIGMSVCLGAFFRTLDELHKFEPAIPENNLWWSGKDIFSSIQPQIKEWLWKKIG